MNTKQNLLVSCFIALGVVLIDRFTKLYALYTFATPYSLTHNIEFELVFNRGISWSMLTFDDSRFFFMVSCLIACVIVFLFLYTRTRWIEGYNIISETLVLAGALSNLVDRFIYGGVIDFIVLSYRSWTFPVFNVADVCIVIGIFGMFLHSLQEPG